MESHHYRIRLRTCTNLAETVGSILLAIWHCYKADIGRTWLLDAAITCAFCALDDLAMVENSVLV